MVLGSKPPSTTPRATSSAASGGVAAQGRGDRRQPDGQRVDLAADQPADRGRGEAPGGLAVELVGGAPGDGQDPRRRAGRPGAASAVAVALGLELSERGQRAELTPGATVELVELALERRARR